MIPPLPDREGIHPSVAGLANSMLGVSQQSHTRKRSPCNATTAVQAGHRRLVLAMACTGCLSLAFRRLAYDNPVVVLMEAVLGLVLIGGVAWLRKVTRHQSQPWLALAPSGLCVLCLFLPWSLNGLAKRMGNGNDMEILWLSSLAWAAMLLAVWDTRRSLSLSVICSGFLTLFTAFTSDTPRITIFVYAWLAVCLWWLVVRHWSSMNTLSATRVQSAPLTRALSLSAGFAAFVAATFLVSDSIPVLRKLRTELMPTSGGHSLKDASARKGIGNGDLLIAARQHASSFGAVETDFFLDSDKPTLFDVFSEEFGEPMRRNTYEQAQALSPQDTKSQEGQFAEANRASGSDFATEREAPLPKQQVADLHADALMYWEGLTGVRLAVERFDVFDGTTWTQSSSHQSQPRTDLEPMKIQVDDALWFGPPRLPLQGSLSPYVDAVPAAIRFTRYGSPSIPLQAGTQLWRIDQLERADFFAYTPDNCLSMTGRDAVPDYTVVRFVNSRIDAERLQQHLRTCAPGESHKQASGDCQTDIAELAHTYAGDAPRGWEQVDRVIRGIRGEFTCAPAAPGTTTSLPKFLKVKQGPSFQCATAAALMLEHLGYQTRLVTGFYVNPEHYVARERATAITPDDAHVWLEVNTGHGFWVPLEPTPGYLPPALRLTWSYWARMHWQQIALALVASCLLGTVLYLCRAGIFRVAVWLLRPWLGVLPTGLQIQWLRRCLEWHWRLLGYPRPPGTTLRQHWLSRTWVVADEERRTADAFLDLYDTFRFADSRIDARTHQDILVAMPRVIHHVRATHQPVPVPNPS